MIFVKLPVSRTEIVEMNQFTPVVKVYFPGCFPMRAHQLIVKYNVLQVIAFIKKIYEFI